jgi:ATP-binding cassette, subfamily B, multidrug efflux pump
MNSLKHINKYLWNYKWQLLLGITFAVLSTFFGIYVAVLVRHATDYMTQALHQKISFQVMTHQLFLYGIYILATTIVSGVFMFLMRQAIIVMSRHIEYDLKNEIFQHYQQLDTAFYRRNSTGDLMNRISEDVSRVRMYIGPAIMYFANTLATLILIAATMTGVNAKLSFYVLLPLPILAVVIYYVSNWINQMSNHVQAQLSAISTLAQETFSGIRVVKAYVQEEAIGKRFVEESILYRKKNLRLIITEGLFSPFIFLLMGISTLLTIYIGGMQAIEGKISYGNIAEFIIYVGKLTWPVASLGWVTSLVQRAAASQERINQFLNTKPDISFSPNYKEGDKITGQVAFNHVSFTYPDSGIKALSNISFKINPGESLAIIGRTGSGKSTLANLICRLYDVSEGEIKVDGQSIKKIDRSFLRKEIGYVPQDTFLFSDTIENNIAFGIKNEPHRFELIEEAARNAGVLAEINRFQDKFKTMIGERGITLSGGQKQRIAIARAIISSPQVLIFDDCLSAVDTETESEILRNLEKVMKGKTSVIISHRVSAVQNASRILVLHAGSIAEEGTHEELMQKRGVYFELYTMQLAEAKSY